LRDVTGRRRLDRLERAKAEELQSALESRVVIEQAKGFLAGRDGGTPEAAFLRLRRHARDHNLTLREVARQLMDRQIPLPPVS
jgi:AmiR/NasT family two-component response regulator